MSNKENKQFGMVVDYAQLEKENKTNILRHQHALQTSAKEKVIVHNTNVLTHYLKHPELLIRKNKLIYAVMNFFFPIQENLEGLEDKKPVVYTGVQTHQHSKLDAIKEDNVIYLNRDYKDI